MKEIDLVYILGSGSRWNNNEIRFSLRSVEKNLLGVRNVYVVGENPGFLSNRVIHLYEPDPLQQNADGNMALKILRACRETSLSDDFLFMNDDFIINKPIVAAEIPWLHKGDMKLRSPRFWQSQFYRYRLRRTFDVLQERGLPTIQYDYHAPMLMNKHEFPKVMAQFDFKADIGYTFRSLYGNCLQLPAQPVEGIKQTIYKSYMLSQLQLITRDPVFIGYNDKGLNNAFKLWLYRSYPAKSIYEDFCTYDSVIEIEDWLNSADKDFRTGLQLFVKHSPNLMLTSRINIKQSGSVMIKLEQKLRNLLYG